jgi:hypothetical protein
MLLVVRDDVGPANGLDFRSLKAADEVMVQPAA